MTRLRCAYLDLDGTLFGRGASLLHDGEGVFTLLGARALEACARAGVEVAFYSGRRRAQLFENARMLGVRAYVFEAGGGVVVDGEVTWLTGELQPGALSVHDQIAASGAPDLLLANFDLEWHAPWHLEREVTHLFRGSVDCAAATALLAEHGLGHLELVDNGAAKHLRPRGASKARGVAYHQQVRGYAPQECLAVGDSAEDLGVAEVVGAFWMVANGAPAPGVRRAQESHGAGVYEAVMTELAERRGGSAAGR